MSAAMPEEQLHLRRDRAGSFGAVARAYDDARPGYPDALIVQLLTRGATDVLDVACGIGRAARQLSARGARVLGVEPDAAMAAVAREHEVEVEVSTFEEWDDAGRRFDLVTCAQGWHWIDPAAGARKAAAVLRPGSVRWRRGGTSGSRPPPATSGSRSWRPTATTSSCPLRCVASCSGSSAP